MAGQRHRIWIVVACILVVESALTLTVETSSGFQQRLCRALAPAPDPTVLATAPAPGREAIPGYSPAGSPPAANAIEQALRPSVVELSGHNHYGGEGLTTTGIVIGQSGLVLTVEATVYQTDRIEGRVGGSGPTYRAAIIGTNEAADVALVQLLGASGLQPARFTSSFDAQTGDPVVVMGSLVGRGPAGTTATIADPRLLDLKFSSRVSPSQSGGPVVDRSGRVIGMFDGIDGTNNYVLDSAGVLDAAARIASGRRDNDTTIGLTPTLGIEAEDAVGDHGARVVAVLPGTPASCIGIGTGDVIVGVEDTDITSAREFGLVLVRYRPGDRIRLDWTTGLGRRSKTVRLAAGSGP